MGGCYKGGSLLSEQKHVTLCIGLHHDDNKGLAAMLGPKPESESAGEVRPAIAGIAAEFAALSDSKELDLDGQSVPCDPVVCLDFAAWRASQSSVASALLSVRAEVWHIFNPAPASMASPTFPPVIPWPTSTPPLP